MNKVWHQNIAGIEGEAEDGDKFGSSLAAGDFNGDGFDDLAIGVPNEDIGRGVCKIERHCDAGAVNIIYGSGSGLTAAHNQLWHQDIDGVEGEAEDGDKFGSSLAAGDFNGDGFDDLAVGVPTEDIGSASLCGHRGRV